MSVDYHDAAMDDMYEHLRDELYPEQREKAIIEFTGERLRSYYVGNPNVMQAAVMTLREAKALATSKHYSAALIFSASAYELLLKATLLRPVLHGLVHNEALAEILAQKLLGNITDISRYEDLLAKLFYEIASLKLDTLTRPGSNARLIVEIVRYQKIRNRIVHAGVVCGIDEAEAAQEVGIAIFSQIVEPFLAALGLRSDDKGMIQKI
jgi:HEPN domain-containing protein